ncbi:MAG: sigma-54-dependent Fis family transcriptional regulator [Acidobacteria bacterium]|nr:sigma-54-dependent Fis family transcriptional regulator [Acidobacteriota bacterium]
MFKTLIIKDKTSFPISLNSTASKTQISTLSIDTSKVTDELAEKCKNFKLIILDCPAYQEAVIDCIVTDLPPSVIILAKFTDGSDAFNCLDKQARLWATEDDIQIVIDKIHNASRGINLVANSNLSQKEIKDQVVFRSPKQMPMLRQIHTASRSDSHLLVTGDTGTGKTTLARFIHDHSRRAKGVFLPINCTTLAEGTMESTLFGHRKGSFTGAGKDHKGLFETANGGTLFLDEIAESGEEFQAQLLQVLQEQKIRKVGDSSLTKVDVRIIAATNRDIPSAIAAGKFRSDLYYRLIGGQIKMLPLAECRENILPAIHLTIHNMNLGRRIAGRETIQQLIVDEQAYHHIVHEYPWPGNNRQLIKFIEHLAATYPDGELITYTEVTNTLREAKIEMNIYQEQVTPFFTLHEPVTIHELKQLYATRVAQEAKTLTAASNILGVSTRMIKRFKNGS